MGKLDRDLSCRSGWPKLAGGRTPVCETGDVWMAGVVEKVMGGPCELNAISPERAHCVLARGRIATCNGNDVLCRTKQS
jgi:hypothetical protein